MLNLGIISIMLINNVQALPLTNDKDDCSYLSNQKLSEYKDHNMKDLSLH